MRILPFLIKKPQIESSTTTYQKKGHWTQKQKLKYAVFLDQFKQKFTSKEKKKQFCRIYRIMSDFLKTRSQNQCRSHHQKMQKQRFQVDSIIKNITSKYHPRVFRQLSQRYSIEIQNAKGEIINNVIKTDNTIKSKQKLTIQYIYQRIAEQGQLSQKEKSLRDEQYEMKQQNDNKNEYVNINEYKSFKFNTTQLRKTSEGSDDEQSILNIQMLIQNKEIQQNRQQSNKQYILNAIEQNQKIKKLNIGHSNLNEQAEQENGYNHIQLNYLQLLQARKNDSLSKAYFHFNQYEIQMTKARVTQQQRSAYLAATLPSKTQLFGMLSFNFEFNPQNQF